MAQLLRDEKDYIKSLENNDGKDVSPQVNEVIDITIDEQDQFTPDNWFPRSRDLVRTTGAHPLNAESDLRTLFDAGFITPNALHYVRNHGHVPRLQWEFHKLEVIHHDKKTTHSMQDLERNFNPVNLPVFIACDGNRRKELNMIKTSKGAPFGVGAFGCSYWKGPLLRDLLLAAGVPDPFGDPEKWSKCTDRWVNFEGSDELPEGNYATCITLEHAMDPMNDVMVAFQMNDQPIPPDHGYPIRLVVPGFVGGRCVKWLRKIWTSKDENDSFYHIWDNRIPPSFVTGTDGELADIMYHHPSTALYEQTLNSAITRPAQGETFPLSCDASSKYRIKGFAYNGSGRMIQRVEISLDGGSTWRYCVRKFPKKPVRHNNRFWTWLHWHVDVSMADILDAREIVVRCFDISNTQPEKPIWNMTGMMNNSWYMIKMELRQRGDKPRIAELLCRHPVEPGPGKEGWMKPSYENQLESAKLNAGGTSKQFTREEIEKHDKEDDCWIVVNEKVYDATSVLSWHPGGGDVIMGHAGCVHPQTTAEYNSIHDSYATKKLQGKFIENPSYRLLTDVLLECLIGSVTDKVAKYLQQSAEELEKESKSSAKDKGDEVLEEHRWTNVKLVEREEVSHDTRRYTFQLPRDAKCLGLGNGQHIEIGVHMRDKMLIRPYTPTRPILPEKERKQVAHTNGANDDDGNENDLHDGRSTFDLTVKTYFPSDNQPGGAMSNVLDTIPIGEDIDIRGPKGDIIYNGNGNFTIDGRERVFRHVSMVLGGTGITPGYSIAGRIALSPGDETELRILDCNKNKEDILLEDEFQGFVDGSDGRMDITHVLENPPDDWDGLQGLVNKDMMKEHLFPAGDDGVVFVCGPPPMIKKAVLPALKGMFTVHASIML